MSFVNPTPGRLCMLTGLLEKSSHTRLKAVFHADLS